jgi:hypothetical protein
MSSITEKTIPDCACTYFLQHDDDGEFCNIPLYSKTEVRCFAKIDPEDFSDISQFKWALWSKKGKANYYAQRTIRIDGKKGTERMHRRIMKVSSNIDIDHKNGNGLDNRKNNMRIATSSENNRNQKPRKNGVSKYKGVAWHKLAEKWRVQIMYNKKMIWLGYFEKNIVDGIDIGELEAAKAYDNAAIKYFGSFACLNFPAERNIVKLNDGAYKMSYIMSEQDVKNIEKKINDLRVLNIKEIFDILANKDLDELVNMCHYFSCGISELAAKIKRFARKKISKIELLL